jgi:hypothetical protein
MAARARSRYDQDDDTGPRSDVYTGLLALSLIAMIVSSLLLFLDYSQYSASKAPSVTVPQPKLREGVQTGQLPPNFLLPPPAPITERPFTKGTETAAAQPVKPVGSEEASAPTTQAPAPVVDPPPMPVADPQPAPVAPPPAVVAPAPTPEPVAVPPTPAPTPAPVTPPPPPLPKSIRNLPN